MSSVKEKVSGGLEKAKNSISKVSNSFFDYLLNNSRILGILFLITYIIIVYVSKNSSLGNINKNYPQYVDLFLLVLLFIFTLIYLVIHGQGNNKTTQLKDIGYDILRGSFYLILFFFIAWIINWIIHNYSSTTANIYNIFFDILIFFVSLSLFYLLIKSFNKIDIEGSGTFSKVINFISQIIFYIPCLIIDLIEYMRHQYRITTRPVYIVFFLEIILITLRFLIPYILKEIYLARGNHLLENPVYIDKAQTLGEFGDFGPPAGDPTATYSYNYAISCWFWIIPWPPNTRPSFTKYANIINYGNKPIVEFNVLLNTLRIQCQIKDGNFVTIYTQKGVPLQKWNNLVINYDSGNMDIFLNNVLVASKPGIVPFMSHENIVIGQDNGIEGAICNVTYYNKVLSLDDISLTYKLLKNKKNPLL